MTAFADLSEVVNRLTGGNSGTPEPIWFHKNDRVAGAASAATVSGRWTSLWQYEGFPGGAGAAPGGTARNPNNTTNGSLFQTDPGGGRQKWLLGGNAGGLNVGTLLVYDRLADISGLNATTTTAQTITGLSVTRYTDAASAGNRIFLEIYTQIGATGTTITCEYTDQDGNTGITSKAVAFGGTGFREAQRIIMVPFADGDDGVRAVTNVDLLATTGTAGDFGVTIARPLLAIPCGAIGLMDIIGLLTEPPGPQEVLTGACLSFAWFPNTATAPVLFGGLSTCER